jgi:hypothetical protein
MNTVFEHSAILPRRQVIDLDMGSLNSSWKIPLPGHISPAPICGFDIENLNFQAVSWLGPVYEDRAIDVNWTHEFFEVRKTLDIEFWQVSVCDIMGDILESGFEIVECDFGAGVDIHDGFVIFVPCQNVS